VTGPDNGVGFFGKVGSHGDFVSRRLSDGFIATWDPWLQEILTAARDDLGPQWRHAFLSAPPWRFALAAGICDDSAWAGVLMPGIDRVGRLFPLTVAARVTGPEPLLAWCEGARNWYDALEAVARSSMHAGFDLAKFDQMLRAFPRITLDASIRTENPTAISQHRERADSGDAEQPAGVSQRPPTAPPGGDRCGSLWWLDAARGDAKTCRLHCQALPPAEMFMMMLGQPQR
jgi:type VI secretion system protein ImpM